MCNLHGPAPRLHLDMREVYCVLCSSEWHHCDILLLPHHNLMQPPRSELHQSRQQSPCREEEDYTYLGWGSEFLLVLVGGGTSLIEDLSAASRLAVDAFLGGVTPTMGLIGLSGDTCRTPSGSTKKKRRKNQWVTMNTATMPLRVSLILLADLIGIIIACLQIGWSWVVSMATKWSSILCRSDLTFTGSGSHAVFSEGNLVVHPYLQAEFPAVSEQATAR